MKKRRKENKKNSKTSLHDIGVASLPSLEYRSSYVALLSSSVQILSKINLLMASYGCVFIEYSLSVSCFP